jgi:hypothetical protein
MTNSTTDPKREPGYRGSLPPREDGLARPWILAVLGIFVLVIILSVAGVPSRFIPDPTPLPTPSSTPVPSESASAEPSASADASAEASASVSVEPSASGSVEPSPSQ